MIKLGRRSDHLGKEQEQQRPRPLLVKLQDAQEKWQILRRARTVLKGDNDPRYNNEGEEADKQLREKLKARKNRDEVG